MEDLDPMDALERTLMTISCGDCDSLPKVADAGRIVDGPGFPVQIMHNGVKVRAGGYHGDWMAQVIRALRGHHEPQEELAFSALLRLCRHNTLMVELGCFWAWYSLWYLAEIPGSRTICVEPDAHNRSIGETNAALNGCASRMAFHSAWVGGEDLAAMTLHAESLRQDVTLPCYNFNSVMRLAGGEPLEMLHLDVQGAETSFLRSIGAAGQAGKVRFVVASTHHSSISGSTTTHQDCVAALSDLGARILVEHSVQESFSGDGLVVASFAAQDRHVSLPPISRNTPERSLFPDL